MAKYLDSLPADAPGRYLGKTAVIGTLDPSTIDGEWWSMDPEDYTQITYIDMGNYFVLGSSPFYSMAEFKNNNPMIVLCLDGLEMWKSIDTNQYQTKSISTSLFTQWLTTANE